MVIESYECPASRRPPRSASHTAGARPVARYELTIILDQGFGLGLVNLLLYMSRNSGGGAPAPGAVAFPDRASSDFNGFALMFVREPEGLAPGSGSLAAVFSRAMRS